MYEAQYHPRIRMDLEKIDPLICEKIKTEHIPKILSNPEIGRNHTRVLKETCTYHFKLGNLKFKIAYVIDKAGKKIFIQMIAKAENFHTLLKGRM